LPITLLSMRRLLPVLLLGALLLCPSVAHAQFVDGPNPLVGVKLYSDPQSPAMKSWRYLQRKGRTKQADLIWKIAREPRAVWVGRFTRPKFHFKVRRIIDSAKSQGAVPVIAVLRAESTQCGPTYTAGGPAADRRVRKWYRGLARAIGGDRVVIAFEPDSVGTIDCLARSRRDDRIKLLRYGVDVLSKLPGATIYLEGGASDWEPARRTAKKLRKIGIAKVRGFMLNVTHYDWTAANIRHGLELSRRVGGKPFVINTSQNGRGPVHYKASNGRRINIWCNPGMRGLGPPPTTATSHPMVDAYLWINRPGYAQSCQGRKIDWYLPRALTLGRFATSWESPPKGTRFGHYKRYSPGVFGVP
jgi:endoglucanase